MWTPGGRSLDPSRSKRRAERSTVGPSQVEALSCWGRSLELLRSKPGASGSKLSPQKVEARRLEIHGWTCRGRSADLKGRPFDPSRLKPRHLGSFPHYFFRPTWADLLVICRIDVFQEGLKIRKPRRQLKFRCLACQTGPVEQKDRVLVLVDLTLDGL